MAKYKTYDLPDGSKMEVRIATKWDLFRFKLLDKIETVMNWIWPIVTGKFGFCLLIANVIGLYSAYVFEMHYGMLIYSFFVGLLTVTYFGNIILETRRKLK